MLAGKDPGLNQETFAWLTGWFFLPCLPGDLGSLPEPQDSVVES